MIFLRDLPNDIFQQDNAGLRVARHVLTFLDAQGNEVLPWAARPPDLPLIKIIWTWAAERLVHHPTSANTVDEVWCRVEAAWNAHREMFC